MSKLLLASLLLFGCSNKNHKDLVLSKIQTDKSQYNGYLIEREEGIHSLDGFNEIDSSFGVVLVHGYYPPSWSTKGYEWTKAIQELTEINRPIWWFRYDWYNCPENNSAKLVSAIDSIINNDSHLDSLWVIGHSYGGLIVSEMAEKWKKNFPISIHAIAAPLSESDKPLNNCLVRGKAGYNIASTVKYLQWRTDHKSDGAFKSLEKNPQNVTIKNGDYIVLPKDWEGGRLGHNRSIQYVVDYLITSLNPV